MSRFRDGTSAIGVSDAHTQADARDPGQVLLHPTSTCNAAESPTDTLQDIGGDTGTVEVAHHRDSDG